MTGRRAQTLVRERGAFQTKTAKRPITFVTYINRRYKSAANNNLTKNQNTQLHSWLS